MSATTENSLSAGPNIKKLGILAGGGALPERLMHACDQLGIECFVVAFKGQADYSITSGRKHIYARLGSVGRILKALKSHDIKDIVMIGSIRRPSFVELRPDIKGARLYTKVAFKALGDDGILRAVRNELEHEGFTVHGVQEFAGDLLMGSGALGRVKPSKRDWVNIKRGYSVAKTIGALDVGQSVIVQEGLVLGIEGVEGTDELIKRCMLYQRRGHGATLVKVCKPQQDRGFDLPTIGPETVKQCALAGMAGIAVESGAALLIDPEHTAKMADEYKLFVYGLSTDDVEGWYAS